MAEAVYVLCALTSVRCAALLFRGYRRGRTRLLFWSSLCFLGLLRNRARRARGAALRAGVGVEMTGATMLQSLWGALAMACAVAGLLFLRLWRLSRERLLLFFALGFLTLALNWIGLSIVSPPEEARHAEAIATYRFDDHQRMTTFQSRIRQAVTNPFCT